MGLRPMCCCATCPAWTVRNLGADFALDDGDNDADLDTAYPNGEWAVVSDNSVTQNGYSTVNGSWTPEVYTGQLRFQQGGLYTGSALASNEQFNPNLNTGPRRWRWSVDYSPWATDGNPVTYFVEMVAESQWWAWTHNEANVGDDSRWAGAIPTEWAIFDIGATRLYGSADDDIFTDAAVTLGFDMQKTGSDALNIIYNGDWTIDGDIKYSTSISILKTTLSCAYQFIFRWTQDTSITAKYSGGYDLDNLSVLISS